MPRTKSTAKRSTGLYVAHQLDGSFTLKSGVARKKSYAPACPIPRVESCVCATDCTGVCFEHFPKDHYSAWCSRFGPPPNGYPYDIPQGLSGVCCAQPPLYCYETLDSEVSRDVCTYHGTTFC